MGLFLLSTVIVVPNFIFMHVSQKRENHCFAFYDFQNLHVILLLLTHRCK